MLKEFFAMGGYGFYIWLAYGAALLIILLNCWVVKKNCCNVWQQLSDNQENCDGD